jgi:hypothetical protein
VTPPTTTLTLSARFGNVPVPDASWTAWQSLPSPGAPVSRSTRYVQYQANLAGTGGATPILQDVTFQGAAPSGLPTLSINSVSAPEGNTGTTNAAFTVALSSASAQTVTVAYATGNGTAAAPGDYSSTSGTLTFPPGTTSQTINVPVVGDVLDEANETFTVTLSSPTNATITTAAGTATIVDNDTAPTLAVNNVTVTEGNSGTANAAFAVTLSAASALTVTVAYATANGTATSPADYAAVSGTLTFAPGVISQTVNVPVVGDVLDEATETAVLNLSNPVNATIADSQGVLSITDNDTAPTLVVNNVTLTEGNSGATNAGFAVTLSAASGQTITVAYATANGTATSPADYTGVSGTLTFAPGVTSQTVNVPVVGDVLDEATETAVLNLSSAVNATIADSQGVLTITDNDTAPSLAINNVSVIEGNSGTKTVTFTVTLSAASGQTISVNYATANGTASSATDYVATSGTLTFAAGTTTRTITVTIRGDTSREASETFVVNLSGSVNATIADSQGVCTIVNDD